MLRNRNSDYNLENSVFSRSSFSRRSLHLTKLLVDFILRQLGELPRATWLDGAIGFADTASWKNLVVTGRSAAKIISTLWQRVPTFHGLVFRDENFKGLAHRKKYREQLLPSRCIAWVTFLSSQEQELFGLRFMRLQPFRRCTLRFFYPAVQILEKVQRTGVFRFRKL